MGSERRAHFQSLLPNKEGFKFEITLRTSIINLKLHYVDGRNCLWRKIPRTETLKSHVRRFSWGYVVYYCGPVRPVAYCDAIHCGPCTATGRGPLDSYMSDATTH